MQETDYAWLAGIIDGEGSIFVSKVIVPENRRGFMYIAQLSVTNTIESLVRRVKEIIGSGPMNRVPEHRSECKDQYQYAAYGGTMRIILPKIIPSLVGKRMHAEKILELLTLYSQGTKNTHFDRVEMLCYEIKALNMKGKLALPSPTWVK